MRYLRLRLQLWVEEIGHAESGTEDAALDDLESRGICDWASRV